jgi:hypothetical protein
MRVTTVLAVLGVALFLAAPTASAAPPACDPLDLEVHINDSGTGQVNCSTADSDPLSFTLDSDPQHGSAMVDATGFVTYLPDHGYQGPDSFSVSVLDDANGESTSVQVSVEVVNHAPVCPPDDFGTAERGKTVSVDIGCTDADGDPLSVSIVTQPNQGTASVEAGELRYTAPAVGGGSASFTYKANDGFVDSAAATVTVRVRNGGPSCESVSTSTSRGAAVTIPLRCTDPDGDAVTLTIVNPPAPAEGTLGPLDQAGRSITFIPAPGFTGNATFTFGAHDDFGGTSSNGVVAIKVEGSTNPTGPSEVPVDDSACAQAKRKLAAAKTKLKHLRDVDAPKTKIDKAKERVKKARKRAAAACQA